MNLTLLKQEIEKCTPEEQESLASFLAVLRRKRDPAFLEELGRRLDDRSPEQWLTLEEAKRQLSSGNG